MCRNQSFILVYREKFNMPKNKGEFSTVGASSDRFISVVDRLFELISNSYFLFRSDPVSSV